MSHALCKRRTCRIRESIPEVLTSNYCQANEHLFSVDEVIIWILKVQYDSRKAFMSVRKSAALR